MPESSVIGFLQMDLYGEAMKSIKNILSRNISIKVEGDSNLRFSLRCYETSTKLFSDRVSIDLMFGRPNQTVEQWEKEIKKVVVLFTAI